MFSQYSYNPQIQYPYQYPNAMGPPEPQQLSQTRPVIPGRLISSIDEIKPNEIPMDGSISVFPARDYSCIYAKTWASDGTIKTFKFVPDTESNKEASSSADISGDILAKLDKIEHMLYRNAKRGEKNVNTGNGSTTA